MWLYMAGSMCVCPAQPPLHDGGLGDAEQGTEPLQSEKLSVPTSGVVWWVWRAKPLNGFGLFTLFCCCYGAGSGLDKFTVTYRKIIALKYISGSHY